MANVNVVRRFAVAAGLVMSLTLCACSVQEKHEGDNKNVDIKTPFGGLKLKTSVEAKDVGIKLYPGATPRQANGDDKHSASVQLGNDRFGLKVVAAEFESQDAPDKVLEFYRRELKSYGNVLECKNTNGSQHLETLDSNDKELKCENDKGDATELKAGNTDRQRIVAVHPNGTGSRFAIAYIQKRGEGL